MDLEVALNATAKAVPSNDPTMLFLRGNIEQDRDPEYFRIYLNRANRRSFFLAKKADVAGELYELSVEEALHAGHIGSKIYEIPFRYGTELQKINIRVHRVGERSEVGSKISSHPRGKVSANDSVCCCDNDFCEFCQTTSSSNCSSIGVVCDSSHCS